MQFCVCLTGYLWPPRRARASSPIRRAAPEAARPSQLPIRHDRPGPREPMDTIGEPAAPSSCGSAFSRAAVLQGLGSRASCCGLFPRAPCASGSAGTGIAGVVLWACGRLPPTCRHFGAPPAAGTWYEFVNVIAYFRSGGDGPAAGFSRRQPGILPQELRGVLFRVGCCH